MKLKRLKRGLSALLAGLIALNAVGISVSANETEYENKQQSLFTYTFTEPENAGENGTAIITGFVENYQELLGSSTEITLPDIYVNSDTNVSYNCKTDITKSKFMRNNNYITSIIFPSAYDNITSSFLLDCTALKKITFRHSGTFKFNLKALSGCTSLEKIYVYSDDLTNTPSASVFTNVPASAIAYVKNEAVKEKLVNWPGSVIVDVNMGSGGSDVIKTSLAERITEVETFLSGIDKTQYNNIEALETELANAKAVYENIAATQEEVDNALSALTEKLSNATKKTDKSALAAKITEVEEFLSGLTSIEEKRYVNLSLLREALAHAKTVNENIKATQTEVDNEVEALTSARNDVQRKPDIQAGELIRYTREYEDYIKNVQEDDFTSSSWYKVKDIYNNSVKMYRQEYPYQLATQEEVDAMTEKMRNFKTLLVKADASEEKVQLSELIGQTEKLDREFYTETSWSAVDTALTEAKAIEDGLKSEYNLAIKTIEDAVSGLAYKPADYTKVNEAKAKVPADLSGYTEETTKAVTDALATVVEGKNITEQVTVDGYAKAIEDAIAKLEKKIKTGNVSGKILVSDKNDSTEMTVTATATDGTETVVTATSMGTYTIENLEAGSYTLTISGGKYAERSYEITVTEGENALDVELNPLGDINGDGKITTADVGMANSHAKGVITLTDYDFACANVKSDESITTADVGMINSHAKGVKPLW